MKFFQSLLVAPAALGLLSSFSVNTAELNVEDIATYSNNNVDNFSNFSELYPSDWSHQAIRDVVTSRGCSNLFPTGSISRLEAASIINSCLKDFAQITDQERRLIDEFQTEISVVTSRISGIESSVSEFEAGSFSSTTVASFSTDFAIGAVDGNADEDAVGAIYGYEIGLSTSFTGEDSLDITLAGGVGGNTLTELDLSEGVSDDALTVDGISYTLPLGDNTIVFVGDGVEGSALFNTACVYEGPSDTLSSCGAVSSGIDEDSLATALGASYDFGNGLTASIGYEGQGDTTSGLATKEGLDAYAGQLAYSTDTYGFSVTFAEIEPDTTSNDKFTAINAFYNPEEGGFPSISIGYEWGDDGSAASTADETSSYFVGLQWDELGEGTFGIAAGTHTPVIENGDELLMYEAYYSYPINDGMTITPLVYTKDQAAGTDDETGIMFKTSFSF
tara:strand:- start:219 stop:1559 length:1341 start_codon:yes stop_codon:yes gene_type:complete